MKFDKGYLFLTIVVIFTLLSWVSSCRHDPLIPSNIPEICFEKEVLPIFMNNCSMSGCHDGRGESRLSYNNYSDISSGVAAGNPNGSRMYQAITGKSGEGRMPPGKPLSLESRMIIRLWIEQGAKHTFCYDSTSQTSGNPPAYNPRACFSRDVLPVLVSACAMTGCHDAVTHAENLTFISYSSTMKAVSPGSLSGSRLYKSITTTSGEGRMPPSPRSRLLQAQIDSIAAWIRNGALNEVCGEVCDTINPVTFSGAIWPAIQTSCTGCHSGSAPSGGYLLTNYTTVQSVAASGLLMKSLNGTGVTKMPPSGSLSTCKIRQFQIWVNNGYKNN